MARPKSQTLFHFTRKLDYLKGILKDGFHPRFCLEDLDWLSKNESYAYPMVCFCDIPLGRVEQHVQQYGNYGIGMSRAWAVRNKLNPVIYVSKDSALSSSLDGLLDCLPQASDEEKDKAGNKIHRYFFDVIRNIKPLTGKMLVNDTLTDGIDFYQESEWRYLALHDDVPYSLNAEEWEDKKNLDDAHAATREHCMLNFNADDVRYLFFERDADIPELVDFIRSSASGLGKRFTGDEMKILETRIVSQESLAQDL